MANQIFNIAKGRDVQLAMNVNANSPANSALVVVLLKTAEADDALNNYDTLGALLAAPGNAEADDTTNYVRKTLTDADGIVITVDDTANTVNIDIPNQVYTSLGGATNNTLPKALVCYDADTTGGTDADIIPLYHFDLIDPNTSVAPVTNGNNFTVNINASGLITQ